MFSKNALKAEAEEHMHLVDNIYFILANLWRDAYLFHQLTDIVHRVVGGSIKFMDIIRPLVR